MSIEQQIGALVEASDKLTGAVEREIKKIDQRVASAEKEFDQFIETADERYKTRSPVKFTVGGSWDKFYPVRISLYGGPTNRVELYRPDLYENKGVINGLDPAVNPETFTASFIAIGDSYGHRVPFYIFDTYHQKNNRFIGKVENHYRMPSLWIWLRGGGGSYRLVHDCVYIGDGDIVSYDDITSVVSGKVNIYLGGYDNPAYFAFEPILEADVDPSLPSNGYIRGVLS